MTEVWQNTFGWSWSAATQAQFQTLYTAILQANQQVNLTRIVEPIEFWEKHIWDSVSGLFYLEQGLKQYLPDSDPIAIKLLAAQTHESAVNPVLNPAADAPNSAADPALVSLLSSNNDQTSSGQTPDETGETGEATTQPARSARTPVRMIDIGTGGGFPGLPIAIARPNWSLTLLDSTQKKIRAVQTAIEAIGLTNCRTIAGRAEQVSQYRLHFQKYDLATVRAVGAVEACFNYALPFLRSGGIALLYRGRWTEEEAASLEAEAQDFGATLLGVIAFQTPLSDAVRHCVLVQAA